MTLGLRGGAANTSCHFINPRLPVQRTCFCAQIVHVTVVKVVVCAALAATLAEIAKSKRALTFKWQEGQTRFEVRTLRYNLEAHATFEARVAH